MNELETRAHRAGEAARAEAAARVPAWDAAAVRADRRPPARVAALLVAGFAVLVAVVLALGDAATSTRVTVDPVAPPVVGTDVPEPVEDADGLLPVPPVGEALPAYLADGTPVFVSHPEEDVVHVLVAFDGHHLVAEELVVWCPASGWFEEWRHGTRYNAYGDYVGGPSPTALADVPAQVIDGGASVRVTGPLGAPRERTDVRAEAPQRGPNCTDADGPEGHVAHEVPTAVPELDGSALPDGRWVWAAVRIAGPTGEPRVCELDGTCPQDAPRVSSRRGAPTLAPDPGQLATLLVRRDGDEVRLAVAGDPRDTTLPSAGDPVERALRIPPPGEAAAEQLTDGTPVWVTHEPDGTLHVLDASSPGRPDLAGWCPEGSQLVDTHGAVWSLAGTYAGGPAGADLSSYPFDVVSDDQARAIQVAGPVEPRPRSEQDRSSLTGRCTSDELVRHEPAAEERIADRLSPFTREPDAAAGWSWIEARIAEVDGELVLCAFAGPDRCGEGPPTDDTDADCYGDLPTGGACADRDPVIVTDGIDPGLEPTDGPVLLLVRLASDGASVEVRRPAELTGS